MSDALLLKGGGGVDLDVITALMGDVVSGKVIVDKDGSPITGTIPIIADVTTSLNCGGSYTIPLGKHSGNGKITANSLASQTSATATAAQVRKGYTGWSGGSKITGTAADKAAATYTPGTANQVIAAGQYLTGAQTVAGDADLISANILRGKNIFNVAGASNVLKYISGSKVSGTGTVTCNDNYSFAYYDVAPGFTPVFALSKRDNGRDMSWRSNSTTDIYYATYFATNRNGWRKFSGGLPWSSSAVRFICDYANVMSYYWIFGY